MCDLKSLSICLKGLLNHSTALSLFSYSKIYTPLISQMQVVCEEGQMSERIFLKKLISLSI